MYALIRQPARNAMQSGNKGNDKWVIQFPATSARKIDPLTGMTGTDEMLSEVHLSFGTLDAAIAYCKTNKIAFQTEKRAKSKPIGRSYGDNFAYDRKFPWTH